MICLKCKCNLGCTIFVVKNGLVFETSKLHIIVKRFFNYYYNYAFAKTNAQTVHSQFQFYI
jgi:hypothetical protein